MTAAKAAAKKAANARGRDQWMRATLVCRHKRRRAAWRTRGGDDSFSAEDILAAVPLGLYAQRGRQQRNCGALIALRFHQNELFLAPRAFSSIGHVYQIEAEGPKLAAQA